MGVEMESYSQTCTRVKLSYLEQSRNMDRSWSNEKFFSLPEKVVEVEQLNIKLLQIRNDYRKNNRYNYIHVLGVPLDTNEIWNQSCKLIKSFSKYANKW